MAYDPERLLDLRVALAESLDELQRLRCGDPAAADATHVLIEACKTIDDRCLPFVRDVLESPAMTAWDRSMFTACDARSSDFWRVSHERQWLLHDDPAELDRDEVLVPPAPVRGHLPLYTSYDDVLAARTCGELQPLQLPVDPSRPAALQYTNVSITPGQLTNLGEHEITRNIARFLGFWSDALPIAYHEHEVRTVYRVEDARVVASVHALSPTGAQFPAALEAATVSGYIVIVDLTKDFGVNLSTRDRDPTESLPITLEHHGHFAAMLYPDAQPVFEPVASADSAGEGTWRLTTSPLATDESIGSWGGKKT